MDWWLLALAEFIGFGVGFWLGQKSIVWYLKVKTEETNVCPLCKGGLNDEG